MIYFETSVMQTRSFIFNAASPLKISAFMVILQEFINQVN